MLACVSPADSFPLNGHSADGISHFRRYRRHFHRRGHCGRARHPAIGKALTTPERIFDGMRAAIEVAAQELGAADALLRERTC